jgi:hypothetical protein
MLESRTVAAPGDGRVEDRRGSSTRLGKLAISIPDGLGVWLLDIKADRGQLLTFTPYKLGNPAVVRMKQREPRDENEFRIGQSR